MRAAAQYNKPQPRFIISYTAALGASALITHTLTHRETTASPNAPLNINAENLFFKTEPGCNIK